MRQLSRRSFVVTLLALGMTAGLPLPVGIRRSSFIEAKWREYDANGEVWWFRNARAYPNFPVVIPLPNRSESHAHQD
jgi:hypothetical protein